MAVYLVVCRFKKFALLFRIGGVYMPAFYHPDRNAFAAARIYVAGILDGHLRIGSMQRASVLMVETGFGADKDFPERPFSAAHLRYGSACTASAFFIAVVAVAVDIYGVLHL